MNFSLTNIINFLNYVLLFTSVFSLVAIGGMFSERSGIINIALEGIMVIGAIAGVIMLLILQKSPNPETMNQSTINFLTYVQGKGKFLMIILPVLVAGLSGAIYSLLLGFASINLKADQTIGGTALNILAVAIAVIFARIVNLKLGAGGTGPQLNYDYEIFKVNIKINNSIYPLNINWFFIITIIVLIVSTIVLYKTKFGLRMRSCGEHPQASASLGVNVYKMRYAGVAISGFLGGIGGAAYIILSVSTWNTEVGVAGAGFLALSVMIFGQWKPNKIFLAAIFFSLFRALSNSFGSLFPVLTQLGFTGNIFNMIPYIMSIMILIFTSKKSRAPKAEGIPYDKGAR